jgi:subtilisin-like proprotein convertase family protein
MISSGPRRAACAVLCAAAALGPFLAFATEPGGDPAPRLRLRHGDFDPLGALPNAPANLRYETEPESGVFIVQFDRKIRPDLLAAVRATGTRLLGYVPDRGYLARLRPGVAAAVRGIPGVRWLGPVQPAWKISPDLGTRPFEDPSRREGGLLRATLDLFPGEDPDRVAAEVLATGVEVLHAGRVGEASRLQVRARVEQLQALAWNDAVAWIEEVGEITDRNNTTRWVVQTDVPSSTTIWDHGLHGEGQIIGHIDGRIDMNSCFFRDPVNNTPSPAHRKVVAYRSSAGLGADSHGTHTAGTSAGDQEPISGILDWNGGAYAAKISHTFSGDVSGFGNGPSNLYAYLQAAHADGARVHTNSWGDDGRTSYTTWCVDIDRFSYDFEDSLVLFAVTNTSTLRTPENAKNVLAVGATQPGTSDDQHCSGGIGPTIDGRRKPEIYAPGCSIVSARNSAACSTVSSSGTSMACPAVTAAGALVRQYFEEGWYPSGTKIAGDAFVPSGALVKATLLNSTVDMTGVSGYPSNREGWGRVLLENALFFGGDARHLAVLADVRNAGGLITDAETTHPLAVMDSQEPLKITLAYTEPAAALLAGAATVNDLDLEVRSPSGIVYPGNSFNTITGQSIPQGEADPVNNVEMVVLGAPEVGTWLLTVRGSAVNQGTQGYALVASGQVGATGASAVVHDGHLLSDDPPLGNGDGIADPGETISMAVTLRNFGLGAVTALEGELSTDQDDMVKVTTPRAGFPDIPGGATATNLAPDYRYTISPGTPCGTPVVLRVDAHHAEGDDTTSFPLEIGRTQIVVPATGLPLTIPKKTNSPLTVTLQVADAITIADVHTALEIEHQDIGELIVDLTSPQGTTVRLRNRSEAGVSGLSAVYDLTALPDGPGSMGDFDFEQAQGTWTLAVQDEVSGSVPAGRIVTWSLDLRSTSAIACSPLTCAEPVPLEMDPTLSVAVLNGSDLSFDWAPLPGAASYRVWSSSSPDFATERIVGSALGTSVVEGNALADPATLFYVVRAVNSCEWEGP